MSTSFSLENPLSVGIGLISDRFAYVDFATPDAKITAITLSERNLEGRRLLIKDGNSGLHGSLFRG